MKKNAFLTLSFLLFALLGQAQNLVNVTGIITALNGGAPVPNHEVFCVTGDSINPVFGQTFSNPDGTYSISLAIPPGFNEVFVSTLANCDPVNPFVSTTASVVNGGANADFQVCNDSFPPFGNCFADFYVTPVDTLTFQFTGFYYSFLDSTLGANTYLWDFGDGTTSTEESPMHTYAVDGFYFVTLTITAADGCVATVQYPFETSFNNFPECMGYILYTQTGTTAFDFSAELYDLNGNIVTADSYNWDFGDGNTSADPTPSHTYAAEGVYTVQLHAVTEDGCEIHSCDVVFAFEGPVDTFWYGCQAMFSTGIAWPDSSGNPFTDTLTVNFIDLSLGGVISWAWDFGDSTTSTDQNPIHTYSTGGIYAVTLAITTVDGCESDITFDICVGGNCWMPEDNCQALFIPVPDSLGGSGIQFLDLSLTNSPVQGWLWDFGDGSTSTDPNPYHVYAQPGVYTVSLIIEAFMCYSVISFDLDTENPWNFASNSNGGQPQLGVSANSVATHEAAIAFESIKLFPNPAQDELSIAFSSKKTGEYALRITDLTGKTLIHNRQESTLGVNATRVNIANLLPGLYLAEIRSGESVQTIKFVKQ